MTILTAKSGKPIDIGAGIEELQADLDALRQYKTGYVNAGLESMDYPTGNLIQSGMAAKYPEVFKIGSGMEGIDALITKLSNGIEGLQLLQSKEPEEDEGANFGKADPADTPVDGSVIIDKPVTTPETELQPQNPDAE
ncbi:hypothetical protein AH06_195 [Erwinia phage AH06]|nr:hypothetical protein AH06_195 [Erwinia phage AH06]